MERRNTFGTIVKYVPFIGMLIVYILPLWRGVAAAADGIDRSIHIWTNALCISAILGEIGSLLVIDRFNLLLTGKTPDIVNDIRDESSEDVAVMYNGIIASTFMLTAIMGFYILYAYTQKRLFLAISTIVATILSIGTAIYILAAYVKIKSEEPNLFSKLSNPVFLPVLICLIQLLVTRKKLVGFIYRNIYEPQGDIYLIAALVIVLCYFLAVAFCHYSNLYCLFGFVFLRKDPNTIQREIERLQGQEQKREEDLRQATKYVDEQAEKVRFLKKIGLTVHFCFIHLKTYIQDRYYSAVYLLSFAKLKITKRFNGLLHPERIRINGIRFCWITAVLELLALDLLLFIYLDADNPCLKFFELLSTVIIIPVLLSWLAELKAKKE